MLLPRDPLSCLLLAALYVSSPASAIYTKNSPVLQLTAQNYPLLISSSNATTLLEFYAPWCGHCKNLAPAYEKAAKSLSGLATVAAIDCDEDGNKQFCGSMGVKGFPTLKIVKPASKRGKKERLEDYNGPRSAKGLTEAVKEKLVDRTTRVKDGKWTSDQGEALKALLVTEKGASPPPLVKALSTDFLDLIEIGWAKQGDKDVVEAYDIKTFPSVIMFPGKEERVPYTGSMKKEAIAEFLSKWAAPHMSPKARLEQLENAKKNAKTTKKKKSEPKKPKPEAASERLNDPAEQSPGPNVVTEDTPAPVEVPISKPEKLTELDTEGALQRTCLHTKSGTCLLAMLPPLKATSEGEDVAIPEEPAALALLSQIAHQNTQRGAKMFPFYSVADTNVAGAALLKTLEVKGSESAVQLLAINAKRGWWNEYRGDLTNRNSLERWIDEIKMGDVTKEKLPEGLMKDMQDRADTQDRDTADSPIGGHSEL
ncbi:MAG: hypothetical protein M1828_005359 [Chrysothrix sp. TS-e1954]|nr:MAG: hypothetical protein M1828_005359 [Chrysothrix sp. TS-e1954]